MSLFSRDQTSSGVMLDTTVRLYVLFTFLLTWGCWGATIIANQFGYLRFGSPLFFVLFLLGGNAPPIVSYIILRRTNVFSGFKNFLSVAFHIKQPIMHYLMLPLFLLIMYVVPVLAGRLTVTGPFYIGLVMIAPMIFGGGLEELGWRLVLQPHLERKMGFVPASLLTGGLWALWHLPLFFIQGVSQYGTNFGIFAVLCLGLAFSLAAVFYISRNIWLCILLHAMYNAFSAVFTIDQSLLTAIGIVILQGAFAILLVSYTKRIQKKQV